LSLRDIEELLFERRAIVSYETIRRWPDKLGARLALMLCVASRARPGLVIPNGRKRSCRALD
jgi:putative transposase